MRIITSISNNFGAGELSFKFHSEDRIAIVQGAFPIDPQNADYLAAERLEIVFPENTFPMESSECGTAFLYSSSEEGRTYAVGLRTFVVSCSTLVIEKLNAYPDSTDARIFLNSGYIVHGQPMLLQPKASTPIKARCSGRNYDSNLLCNYNRFENDWGFACIMLEYLSYTAGEDMQLTLTGFPTDVNCEAVVMLSGHTNFSGVGTRALAGRLENGVFYFRDNDGNYSVSSARSYFFIYFVREGEPAPEEQPAE